MHFNVLLLAQAVDKDDAIMQSHLFLEKYQDIEYDWYQIGGRWTQTLAPESQLNDYLLYLRKFVKGYTYVDNEIEAKLDFLQIKWEQLGLQGLCPHHDHYSIGYSGNYYDCIPYKQIPEQYMQKKLLRMRNEIQQHKEDLEEAKIKPLFKGHVKYINSVIRSLQGSKRFSNECFFYDITKKTTKLPKEKDEHLYWVINMDLHN